MLDNVNEDDCNRRETERNNNQFEKSKLSSLVIRRLRSNKVYRRKFCLTLAVFWSYVTLVSYFNIFKIYYTHFSVQYCTSNRLSLRVHNNSQTFHVIFILTFMYICYPLYFLFHLRY